MILETYLPSLLPNLVPWMAQGIVVAAVAALLPAMLQVRHPRTRLAYCHGMLAVCLLLPFLQPWRHRVIVVPDSHAQADDAQGKEAQADEAQAVPASRIASSSPVPSAPAAAPAAAIQPAAARLPVWRAIPTDRLLLAILAAGVLGRLSWLIAGLWHIRRYRIAATPLYSIPESVEAASALTHADALFCISADVPGPVMLGAVSPVVLLPESFLKLDEEAQCGIAAHELLHVRRKDWLVTVIEELAGALLWFNPAVWWLLAQTRLAREQVVDAEAVRLTSARESYVHALLAIARSRTTLDLAPAPLFLRRRHLTQRMNSLLKDVAISKLRLAASYASIAAAVAFAGWLTVLSFPLVGRPQIQIQPQTSAATAPQPAVIASAKVSPPPSGPVRPPLAPVPADVQEPVMGAIEVPATPADRAAALALLERARQNSDMHIAGTPAFRLEATFLASGNVKDVGSGALSETWISGQSWRWTANLGTYSQVRIGAGQAGYDEQPVSAVPARVHLLRNAIFSPLQFSANPRIRTARAQWNGKPVTCILLGGDVASTSASRLWKEQEYCLDDRSGLLQMKSPAPGAYVIYEYGKNLQFHGRLIPDRITASIGGLLVLDAQVTIADAGSVDASLLTPGAEMIARGPGPALAVGQKFLLDAPAGYAADAIQTVIVHAELNAAGVVLEEEISASADPRLSQAALDLVKQHTFPPAAAQRDVYISVGFVPSGQ